VAEVRIIDVEDEVSFALVPPCADPTFDHRTCDYWEDADRGSKRARSIVPSAAARIPAPANPFHDPDESAANPGANPFANPFAPPTGGRTFNPFAPGENAAVDNPFAPARPARATLAPDAPRKLALLVRGRGVFGSYAKVLLVDDEPAAYAQFGPLSAYPRATRVRDLYAQLPEAPLPAVITCIATTPSGRRQGHALALVAAVCEDLAGRGFAAVEVYPEAHSDPNATSAATPAFWLAAGFALAVDDERFPVMRREL
jgi:GNAT superfamily N-acetyltransferase